MLIRVLTQDTSSARKYAGNKFTGKAALIGSALFMFAANSSPAIANSANLSDNFRVTDEESRTALGTADPEFRALHNSWGRTNGMPAKVEISIPSYNPVDDVRLSSGFGRRRAPTRGASRMHKGIDIPGPIGTPIYATADGLVGRAQWVGGYGKFVEIEHGNQIQTRYGHMSALNVNYGQRVNKGDIIGYMGSTGRSTGSHLHYEVRIGGIAVNPISFMDRDGDNNNRTNSLLAAKHIDNTAIGGPE